MGKLSNLTIAYFWDGLGKKPSNQDNISMALGFITVRAKDALIAGNLWRIGDLLRATWA